MWLATHPAFRPSFASIALALSDELWAFLIFVFPHRKVSYMWAGNDYGSVFLSFIPCCNPALDMRWVQSTC